MALLLAFSATAEELEIPLISVTYGNVTLADCFCNTIALLRHVRAEIEWRQQRGHEAGFAALRRSKPLLALGCQACLADKASLPEEVPRTQPNGEILGEDQDIPITVETHFDQALIDDLIHRTYEQFPLSNKGVTFLEEDRSTATNNERDLQASKEEIQTTNALFTVATSAAHEEILRVLRANETNTVTIVALGPLTNLALAMAKDATTFSRAQEIVIMGGDLSMTSIGHLSNPDQHDVLQSEQKGLNRDASVQTQVKASEPPFRLTTQAPGPLRNALIHRNRAFPKAEFNTFADPLAAAYVYSSTSPSRFAMRTQRSPQHVVHNKDDHCQQSRATDITLLTHDITKTHTLDEDDFQEVLGPLVSKGSPLAMWLSDSLLPSFEKSSRSESTLRKKLSLNDPLCIWYCLSGSDAFEGRSGWQALVDQDIRVKVTGEWTKGATVLIDKDVETVTNSNLSSREETHVVPNNKLRRCIGIPDKDAFGRLLLSRVSS